MKQGSRASPVIQTASFACDVLPHERSDSDRYPSGCRRMVAIKFHLGRAAAASAQ